MTRSIFMNPPQNIRLCSNSKYKSGSRFRLPIFGPKVLSNSLSTATLISFSVVSKIKEDWDSIPIFNFSKCVKNFINPNYNPRGKIKIPLIEAVISSSINVVSILLRHRALPYLTLNGDGTALHYAAALGHTNIVRLLIRHEANINSPNKAGYTPLFLAIQYNHIETARHLIEMGASLHAQCKETALTLASYAGHYQLVKTITSKVPNEEKDQKREYYVALSQASFKGFTRIIKLLLRLGADVNASYEGVSPPLFASIYGNRVITARYLISKNANIEARNQGGYTPLMEAAKRGHEGMMKILLDAGADTNAKSLIEKETAYEFAQSGKFHDVCVLLAKHNIKEHAI